MSVEILEREDKSLEVTDEKGTKSRYYPGRQIFIDVHDLQLGQEIEASSPGAYEAKTYATGTAVLHDPDISIIGSPGKTTRKLTITFLAQDVELKTNEVLGFGDFIGNATLGMSPADREFDSDENWFVSCYIYEARFAPIQKAIQGGRMSSMRITLGLQNLYTQHHPMAPYSMYESLFIRPADPGKYMQDWPKFADGGITKINMRLEKVDMPPTPRAEHEPGSYDFGEPDPEPQPAPPPLDPVAVSVKALTANIEAFRKTVKWVGGIIVVMLFMLAIK